MKQIPQLALKCVVIIFIATACKNKSTEQTEKYQNDRNNIIDVRERIVEIKTDIIFGRSILYILDDFLIVNETEVSGEKGIHLFQKNTFEYITSTGFIGRGPGEISRPGRLGIDHTNKAFWAPDHGKRIMFKFILDSILENSRYKPTIKRDLNRELFLERFELLNDSIALGKAVHVIDNSSFDMAMAKLNIKTNNAQKFGYEHPEAVGKKSNSFCKISTKNKFYVNAYVFSDLITICDLNGNLKFNIYGSYWQKNNDNKNNYFSGVDILDNHILISYIGDVGIIYDKNGNPLHGNSPSLIQVFDFEGNYIQTLDIGEKFSFFCVDEENNRIIIYFEERGNPLAYFDLN